MPKLLDKVNMPIGKNKKQQLDDWLNQNVNVPLAEKGYENTGAALSAAVSAAGELLIPENLADVALSIVPGAKLVKAGKKGMRALKIAEETAEKAAPALNYAAIELADKAKRSKEISNLADTLRYGKMGEVTRETGKTLSRKEMLKRMKK